MNHHRVNPMRLKVSESQRDRLYDLAASGPLYRKDGDEELERMGLIQEYEMFSGESHSVEPVYNCKGNACYFSEVDGRFLPKVK